MSHAASGALPIGVTEFALARRRAILSCAIGNFFELFDFTIYGFFAVAISRAFFPAGDPVLAMASTFATFGVAFVLRPVGAIVLGAYGDRAGRRAALVVTIGLMATATGMTGLIPTYASIGIWAPILLLICRMMQGFSTGGEWGGAATFLVEYAPTGKRGITGSWQQFSTQIGSLAGSTAATVLATGLSETAFYSWGWRLPFLFGFLLGPIGYYLRRKVAETPVFTDTVERRKVERALLRVAIRDYSDRMIQAFGLSHHRLHRWVRLHRLSRQLCDQHHEASRGRGTIVRHGVRHYRGDTDAVLRRIVRSDRAQATYSGMCDA
jgi:MFS transporter, MHS family, proline/betaine transporter